VTGADTSGGELRESERHRGTDRIQGEIRQGALATEDERLVPLVGHTEKHRTGKSYGYPS
jgi:hypothetical protein